MTRWQISNSSFIAMTPMQLDQPTSSASTFWYPTLVGSYKVSHKMLRNPYGSCTNLRWTNQPHSTSVHRVIPKLMKIIMEKVGFRSVTIRTILAQVTFFLTSVANAAFSISWFEVHLLVLSWLAWRLLAWRVSFLLIAAVILHYAGQTRSNRPGGRFDRPWSALLACGQSAAEWPFSLHI
jgi:hypothetical protein